MNHCITNVDECSYRFPAAVHFGGSRKLQRKVVVLGGWFADGLCPGHWHTVAPTVVYTVAYLATTVWILNRPVVAVVPVCPFGTQATDCVITDKGDMSSHLGGKVT